MSRSSLSTSTEAMLVEMLVAISRHWLITPMRRLHVTSRKTAIVVTELVIGLGVVGYAVVRRRRERTAEQL